VIKKIGSWKSAYLYDPAQLILKSTTPLGATTYSALSLGFGISNIVGTPTTFFLSVTPSIDITSYFVVKFPNNFISDQFNIFKPNCTLTSFEIFTRSNLLRIYPQGGVHKKGININYTITNFPSTESAIPSSIYSITVEGYSNYKQVNTQIYPLSFQSFPCQMKLKIIDYTSPYIFEENLTYTF
jgi:hypothetical protein